MNNRFRQVTQKPEADGEMRQCLVCGKEFLSQWVGNRVCKRCKTTSTWRGGA